MWCQKWYGACDDGEFHWGGMGAKPGCFEALDDGSTIADIWAIRIDPDEGLVDGCCVGARGSTALTGVSALRRPARRRVDDRAGAVILKGALSNIRHRVPSTFSTYLHQFSDTKLWGF